MKQWMARASVPAGALLVLLAIGKPASAELVGLTIKPSGTVSGGNAIVSGTITSNSVYADFVQMYVSVQQIVRGHVVAYGEGYWENYVYLTRPWSFSVSSDPRFKAGSVVVGVYAVGQDLYSQIYTNVVTTANVSLRGR